MFCCTGLWTTDWRSWVISGHVCSITSQVISVAFYIEREKTDKFCSEALISAWGYFMCSKSTTRKQWLYFPSKGSHTQNFYALKIHRPRSGLNPRTSNPVASMIITGSPGSTVKKCFQSPLPEYWSLGKWRPNFPLPLIPVLARWGSSLNVALYYATHLVTAK